MCAEGNNSIAPKWAREEKEMCAEGNNSIAPKWAREEKEMCTEGNNSTAPKWAREEKEMCAEGNNSIAPKWAREEKEINSGSTRKILNVYTMPKVTPQYISTLTIHKIPGNPLGNTEHKLHYLTICNVALGRSQRPTGQLSAKRNFKDVWPSEQTPARQPTADCLHYQDYLIPIRGLECGAYGGGERCAQGVGGEA
jgi:hypothetical protein